MTLCTYCLQPLDKRNKTKDHIFPKSWYPDDTPVALNKWTVPACVSCNTSLTVTEEALFLRWGSGVDQSEPGAKGIYDRAFKAINFHDAKDEKVSNIRRRAFDKISKDLIQFNPNSTIRGLGPKAGVRTTLAIRTSHGALKKFGEKIIKGLEYHLRHELVRKNRDIKIYFPNLHDPEMDKYYQVWERLIEPIKQSHELGPGFKVKLGVNPKFPDQVIYHIKIWGHIEFWGLIFGKQ